MTLTRITRVLLVGAGSLLLLPAGCDQADAPVADTSASGASSAALPPEPVDEATTGDPELTFTSLEHDLGEMWDVDTDPKTYTFEFTNTGDGLLMISDIRTSCGCTTAELEKREYLPGEGAAIEVTFNPKNRQGRQTKTVDIVTNAERQGPMKLRISAEVKAFVAVEPRNVRFGDVRLGEAQTAIVELSSVDPDLVIESIANTGNHVEARLLDRAVPLGPRREGEGEPPHRIEVTLDGEAPWGETNRTLMIKCRGRLEGGEEIEHSISLNVRASVFGELRAEPTNFRLGGVQPGAVVEKRVRLTSETGEPFAVLDVRLERASPPGLEVRAELIAEAGVAGYDIILAGNAGEEAPKSIQGTVVIETDVEGEERLELRCSGIVRELES